MNSDPKKSAQPCGCDEGADHICVAHLTSSDRVTKEGVVKTVVPTGSGYTVKHPTSCSCDTCNGIRNAFGYPGIATYFPAPPSAPRGLFPDSAAGRKAHPIFTGVLMYFPDAIAAVARVSKKGNDQHNPGEPLHWAREKSTDQTDTATRHMMDHGVGTPLDTDGEYHLAKAAWRILAELQLTIEKDKREGR